MHKTILKKLNDNRSEKLKRYKLKKFRIFKRSSFGWRKLIPEDPQSDAKRDARRGKCNKPFQIVLEILVRRHISPVSNNCGHISIKNLTFVKKKKNTKDVF